MINLKHFVELNKILFYIEQKYIEPDKLSLKQKNKPNLVILKYMNTKCSFWLAWLYNLNSFSCFVD